MRGAGPDAVRLDVVRVEAARRRGRARAFFGIPMSMNAASMPGRTFWTRPDVDVAVDLVRLVGDLGDGVLDEGAALEGGDVGGPGRRRGRT